MVLDKEIEITLGYNLNYYKNLGYNNVERGNKLFIKVEDLPQVSTNILNVKCDICGKEKRISYFSYTRNVKKYNLYTCSKCATIKIKKTNIEKYGFENVFQNKEIKDKIKKSNLEKYGVEYTSQTKESRDNFKLTNMSRYGVENIMQTQIGFEKQQKKSFLLKKHENTGLYYRGSYEKDFLDFCCERSIRIKNGKRFEYVINNKKHYYFSDFYYENTNLIVEIKSEWTYNNNLEINLLKEAAKEKS